MREIQKFPLNTAFQFRELGFVVFFEDKAYLFGVSES
jgi:hypothetical protein